MKQILLLLILLHSLSKFLTHWFWSCSFLGLCIDFCCYFNWWYFSEVALVVFLVETVFRSIRKRKVFLCLNVLHVCYQIFGRASCYQTVPSSLASEFYLAVQNVFQMRIVKWKTMKIFFDFCFWAQKHLSLRKFLEWTVFVDFVPIIFKLV